MSALDLYEGAAQLPHVYCKKIILENNVDLTRVTLNLELLIDANKVNSGWAKQTNFKFQGKQVNFFNSFFVQVTPVVGSAVRFLKASNDPANLENSGPTNIYVAKRQLEGTNWIPYGFADSTLLARSGRQSWDELGSGVFDFLIVEKMADPINLSSATIFGDHTGEGVSKALTRGKVRTTIKNGKQYYTIPLSYKLDYDKNLGDLGFMFYSMMHAPYFVKNFFGIEDDSNLQKYYKYIKFGPMNSEVVFENGLVSTTREQFVTNNGSVWNGSVHLHASNIVGPGGPDQDGYAGNGGFGPNGGWMAGEQHIPNANQPKLRLVLAQNDKIDDFRIASNPPTPANVIGTFDAAPSGEVLPNALVNSLVGPFQKITRKDFQRKNDDQYSVLYHTRGPRNIFRASFFINFRNFIKNNSSLYQAIFSDQSNSFPSNTAIDAILTKSKILEMKLFRKRVDKEFENTAKKLIAVISEDQAFGDLVQGSFFREVVLDKVFNGKRMFTFNDVETENITAGNYKYSLQIKFKDGSYEYLTELINSLKASQAMLAEYYDLASSSRPVNVGSYTDSSLQPKSLYKATKFKPYFSTLYNTFSDSFSKDLLASSDNVPPLAEKFKLPGDEMYIWEKSVIQLFELKNTLGLNIKDFSNLVTLHSMLSPIDGSPNGINYVIKIYNDVISNLATLLGNKNGKGSGGEFTTNNLAAYNDYSLEDYRVPSNAIIEEDYDFDHPKSLYRASSLNNLFVDYLEIGMNSLNKNYNGLISLSSEYFKNRCILDAVKFSTLASTKASFNTTNIGQKLAIPRAGGDIVDFEIQQDEYLSDSGYSFLTPSTVFFSNNSLNEVRFFTCFNANAQSTLNTGTGAVFDLSYLNCDYEALLAVLMKYTNQRIENKSSDIITNNSSYDQRVSHVKSLLNDLGITFHGADQFSDFFNVRPGAVNGQKDGIATPFDEIYKEPSGLQANKYSDGFINPKDYFNTITNILSSNNQFIIKYPRYKMNSLVSPALAAIRSAVPNNIKLVNYQTNREQISQAPSANIRLQVAKNEGQNAYLFFNFNMTAAIEVYDDQNQIAKDDTGSWRLLTEDDLNVSANKKLFCRVRPYFSESLADIDLPIINEYFFIGPTIATFSNPTGATISSNLAQAFEALRQKLLLQTTEDTQPNPQNLLITPASTQAPAAAATGAGTSPAISQAAATVAPAGAQGASVALGTGYTGGGGSSPGGSGGGGSSY